MLTSLIKLPVFMLAAFIATMFFIETVLFDFENGFPNYVYLSASLFLLGIVIIAVGGYSFRKANTTVNPLTPDQATRLVTTGIYSVSRNPMYIGFFAMLLASCISVGNLVNGLLLPVYVYVVNRLYIFPEEKALHKLFKQEFIEYKNNVRRWI